MAKQNKKYDFNTLFGDDNNNTTTTEETIMRSTYNIIKATAILMTPLLQLDSTGKQRVKYVYDDGISVAVPFYSANGIRGVLRRIMTAQQIRKAKEINPDFTVSADIFYLYAQGAALDKISMKGYISTDQEGGVRANAPIISLFGAGLSAIEGKLAVTDLNPRSDVERFATKEKSDGTEFTYSPLLGTTENFRTDAIRSEGIFSPALKEDFGTIKEWSEDYNQRVVAAKDKKSKDEKEEISHIAQPHTITHIIEGVPMTTSVGSKFGKELTEVELGGLISAFKELSLIQIGSAKRIGYGILDWEVRIDNTLMLRSVTNPDFTLDRRLEVTEEGERAIKAWEAWLEENATNMEQAVSPAIEA